MERSRSDKSGSWAEASFLGLRRGSWGIGVGVVVGVACLVAGGAITQLVGVKSVECTIADEELSATRLYCAQQSADKRTVDDLQVAIRLANSIPVDDPLRLAGDRKIREWSEELLRLGEGLYQDGKLEDAIAAARSIPGSAHLNTQVERQVKDWQSTWEKAETLYEKTQQAIDDRQWGKALSAAREILGLDNTHWQTVKYPEIMAQLEEARRDQEGSTKAQRKPRDGKDLLAAWKLRKYSKTTAATAKSEAIARSDRSQAPDKPSRVPSSANPTRPIDNVVAPPMPDVPPPAPLPVLPVVDTEPVPILGDTQPIDTLPPEFGTPAEKPPGPSPLPASTP